jgi:hypothetical protein
MRAIRFLPVLILVALVWFFYASDKGSKWLSTVMTHDNSGLSVGRLVDATGAFKRIHEGEVEDLRGPLAEPLVLHDGDRIETNKGASVLMILNSQMSWSCASLAPSVFRCGIPKTRRRRFTFSGSQAN